MARDAPFCRTCGASLSGEAVPFELVLGDGTRVALAETVTMGRAPGNDVRIDDDSVSRRHARIVVDGPDAPEIEDVGSTYGTFVDGKRLVERARLVDGARIQVGDTRFRVERRRATGEAGRTIVVPAGASLVLGAALAPQLSAATAYDLRPRIRSGWALKRLSVSEGDKRWVLKDLRSGAFTRMTDADAELFELIDGRNSLHELIAESERRFGASGAARLARLLSDLGDRGLLEGVAGGLPAPAGGGFGRLFRPREWAVHGVGLWFDRLYRRGGWVFFTRPALAGLLGVATAGVAAFAFLIVHRYGTPFVVASKIGLGGVVFLGGRFLVVAIHELAHGLTVTSMGRRVPKAGVKLLLVFPYAFVDTSDAWFEPRRRRLAISAAGPFSDLVVGGTFALAALALPAGTTRDIVFQVAFAAYVGAFFNLNPLLDRDGYNLLVDLLREPGLRRRSRERLARRLAGAPAPEAERRIVAVYAVAALGWSVVGVAFAVLVSTRYWGRFETIASKEVIVGVFGVFYGLMLVPVAVGVGRPLLERRRSAVTGVDGATA